MNLVERVSEDIILEDTTILVASLQVGLGLGFETPAGKMQRRSRR